MVKSRLPFQFITTTGEDAVGKSDVVTRRLVRAQARRQAHRNNTGLSPSSGYKEDDSVSGGSLPQSPKIHVSRFKLASWQRRKKSKRVVEPTEAVTLSSEITEQSLSLYHLPTLKLIKGIGPINVLPIPLNPSTVELLYYCESDSATPSFKGSK
jgi:hypothetical protein